MKISVVIPCCNEESSIKGVLTSLPKEVDEVIVVDSNSVDRTTAIALSCGARVIEEKKRGYGAAIKKGVYAAQGDVVVTIDGDGQHPVEKILPMVRQLEEQQIDFIVGSRFPLGTATMQPVRIIGNHFFNIVVRVLFGIHLSDSQSGMWVFRRSVLDRMSFESDGMSISQEFKIRVAMDKTLRFAEHHITCRERDGVSKLSPLKDGIGNLQALFRLRWLLWNQYRNDHE